MRLVISNGFALRRSVLFYRNTTRTCVCVCVRRDDPVNDAGALTAAVLRIARGVQTIAVIAEERAEDERDDGHGDVRLLVHNPVDRRSRPSDNGRERGRGGRASAATSVTTFSTRPPIGVVVVVVVVTVGPDRTIAESDVVLHVIIIPPPFRASLVCVQHRSRPIFVTRVVQAIVRIRVVHYCRRRRRGVSTCSCMIGPCSRACGKRNFFSRISRTRKPFVTTV